MKPKEKPIESHREKHREAISLNAVSVGEYVTVVSVSRKCPRLFRRLTQFGLVPGTRLKVVRVAPLGCPVQIELRGYCLAIRVKDAAAIMVSY